jgi:hypothetical protein
MTARLAFDRLVHSDWSVSRAKRWSAVALRSETGWRVDRLEPTPSPQEFPDALFDRTRKTLAGFDFAIGLPSAYLDRTQFDFCQLLTAAHSARTQRFLSPVPSLADISPAQPFYQAHPRGARHADLLRALGCDHFIDLLRQCDRKTVTRSRAESVFWTVGARQVGKAALAGWREVVIPLLESGANLWPYDGALESLDGAVLTLAETYPAEAYRHVGMPRTVRKRAQAGRRAAGAILLDWASRQNVEFASPIRRSIVDGFGDRDSGEDPFDALAGLCGMIEVADGRRAEAPAALPSAARREGWILGQTDLPSE